MWYLIVFFISMVPIVEIRGAVPVAVANDLNLFWTYVICILGNMLPVPIIYLFARKVLEPKRTALKIPSESGY